MVFNYIIKSTKYFSRITQPPLAKAMLFCVFGGVNYKTNLCLRAILYEDTRCVTKGGW